MFPVVVSTQSFSDTLINEVPLTIGLGLYFNLKSMVSKGTPNGDFKALRKYVRAFCNSLFGVLGER